MFIKSSHCRVLQNWMLSNEEMSVKKNSYGRSLPFLGGLFMDTNWYVIQVKSGHEEKIAEACRLSIPKEVLIESFVPKYRHQKKFKGTWHLLEEVLFKGYVFLISDQIQDLFYHLTEIPELTKLLGNDGDEIYPLTKQDAMLIERFIKDDYILDMSIGYIEGDQVFITEGPLKGHEGFITKIDRHKRLAYLDVPFMSQTLTTKVGLEIISKK